ncbi:hypothetical protein LUX29_02540 [Aureimonas altamirensis]|uniref:hypothetical protein n=1 Tax=Aureimonas altamirensis TaxID=370622 RepID=UPI001E2E4F1B|nr:hypothetical protein [Aureimonas altamirensis]UHD46141.1 hypothetical protein LUX29_02540 [Aureimonas altamirensis]
MKGATAQFCRQRAYDCRLAADNSVLLNVRLKLNEAEASWLALADVVDPSASALPFEPIGLAAVV